MKHECELVQIDQPCDDIFCALGNHPEYWLQCSCGIKNRLYAEPRERAMEYRVFRLEHLLEVLMYQPNALDKIG